MKLFNQENIEKCFKTGKPYGRRVTIGEEDYSICDCDVYLPGTDHRKCTYLCLALSAGTVEVPEERKYFLCARKNKEK